MFEKDLKMAWNNRRDDWQENLEARAAQASRPERIGVVPRRVDLNDPESRLIRQALLEDERETARRALRWRTIALVVALVIIGWQAYLIVHAQRIFGC